MQKVLADRLIELCFKHSEEIARSWYKALSTNSRTTSNKLIPEEAAMRHAIDFYQHIGDMFFAQNCYQAVEQTLDIDGLAEDYYGRGIHIEELIYSLILMRRHIWLQAETQSLYEIELNDMYSAVTSINRVLLIFDYASYIVSKKYREMEERNCDKLKK